MQIINKRHTISQRGPYIGRAVEKLRLNPGITGTPEVKAESAGIQTSNFDKINENVEACRFR